MAGYSVSNSATVKIRDLDAVGEIIDEVADAGGNYIRINGVNFIVENPQPFLEKLQEAAISDARAKAQRFANLSDVKLGRLVFLSDNRGPLPGDFGGEAFAGRAYAAAAPGPATAINLGQLELRMTVLAVFDIQ